MSQSHIGEELLVCNKTIDVTHISSQRSRCDQLRARDCHQQLHNSIYRLYQRFHRLSGESVFCENGKDSPAFFFSLYI